MLIMAHVLVMIRVVFMVMLVMICVVFMAVLVMLCMVCVVFMLIMARVLVMVGAVIMMMSVFTAEMARVETLFQMHDLHLGIVLLETRQPDLLEGYADGEIEGNRRQLGHLAGGRIIGVRAVARLDQRRDLDMISGQLIDHPLDGRHADGDMQWRTVFGLRVGGRQNGKRTQHAQRQATRGPRTQRALDPDSSFSQNTWREARESPHAY